MPDALAARRAAIRDAALAPEDARGRDLAAIADLGEEARKTAQARAAAFVREARASASRSSLIDKFLQEYGLSTTEGVTLMRLAEALLRTPDAATADALIRDKVEAGDWSAHLGRSPSPLVNFSTRALMLTAAWLDDVEARDPARRILKATKGLIDRLGDPTIRAAVGQAMNVMGDHFVLGETIEEALKNGRSFASEGYTFSYDMLGEAALTARDAEKFYEDYAGAIAAITAEARHDDVTRNPGISVKLSALHPRYEYPKRARLADELTARVKDLALKAKKGRLGFNIDAEEADRLEPSLDIIEALMRDPDLAGWDGFGVVVQAYQRRSPDVVSWLADLARETDRRIMVRLVKGAYWDTEIKRAQVLGLKDYPVYTRKVFTDVSFLACARRLFENIDVFYPQFATHNALSAAMVRGMAPEGAAYELQRLQGMGEALHDRLLAAGARSRIYAPVGGHRELLPYLVRRLLENGANSSFVNQLFDPDLSVDDIVADPFERIGDPGPSAIPGPRDLFDGVRLSAEGWDFTEPETAARLEEAVARRFDPKTVHRPLTTARLPNDLQAHAVANPADPAEIIGEVLWADRTLVDGAVAAAKLAQPDWARIGPAARGRIIRKAADLLEERAPDFMALATREAGKTIPDAIAEVREAVDFLRYYPNRGEERDGEPLGVAACVSPWNFPLAIFLGQITGALSAGNAVVAKPAEQTPLIAHAGVQLLHDAGVPEDVLHLLPGDGPSVGGPLTTHKDVSAVVFTGSTDTAQIINRGLAEAGKWDASLIAETGGVNAMIIDSTALLEQAVKDVVASAFQSAGQRCSACRLVCVQEDIADRFEEMLAGAMAELKVGDPAQLEVDVGPVIDPEAHRNISAHIDRLRKTARLVAEAPGPETSAGHFIRPVAFGLNDVAEVGPEIFGPVLHIVHFPAAEIEEIVEAVNALGYGLTMGVHTRVDETMHRLVGRARVGNVYVNRNQIGAVVGVQPFGGEGLSGTGPKAGGPHYVEALQKAPAPPPAETLEIDEDSAPPLLNQTLARAVAAFEKWREFPDRRAVLAAAARAALARGRGRAAQALAAAADFARDAERPVDLPGPTGESNTLRLRGRGLIACLGPGPDARSSQAARALALGSVVVTDHGLAEDLAAALDGAGAPADVAVGLPLVSSAPVHLLTDGRVSAVAADISERKTAVRLARILADREGALTPVLTSADPVWRYGVERTLTINTTAAGGDVRLLSLPQ